MSIITVLAENKRMHSSTVLILIAIIPTQFDQGPSATKQTAIKPDLVPNQHDTLRYDSGCSKTIINTNIDRYLYANCHPSQLRWIYFRFCNRKQFKARGRDSCDITVKKRWSLHFSRPTIAIGTEACISILWWDQVQQAHFHGRAVKSVRLRGSKSLGFCT